MPRMGQGSFLPLPRSFTVIIIAIALHLSNATSHHSRRERFMDISYRLLQCACPSITVQTILPTVSFYSVISSLSFLPAPFSFHQFLFTPISSADSADTNRVEETKNALAQCWKYNLGCHAYFSSGAARGSEMKRLPEFKDMQLLWNSLRFQLYSLKNQKHGQHFNEMVDHYLPPSVSRRCIVWNLLLLPALQAAGYSEPANDTLNAALSDMFQHTMNLPAPMSTKVNRDFIAVLTDYIAPRALAKTSTTSSMASQFHHSQIVHDKFYSAETYRKDKDGNFVRGPLLMAHQIWTALGEDSNMAPTARPVLDNVILTKSHYDYAAKYAFGDSMATVKDIQYNAIIHASSPDVMKHAFVLMGCGTGKSGIYNLLLLAAYLNGCQVRKTIVISPHNSLLSQHKMQARKYLRGTSIRVLSLLPADIQYPLPTDFDLLFVSIHAFNDIITNHGYAALESLNVDNIFIDEYHNIVGELFRYNTSWKSLRLIAAMNIKVMCLSATADDNLMTHLASFMGLGNFVVIGNKDNYPIPNVAINMHKSVYNEVSSSLIPTVVQHCRELVEKKSNQSFKIHAITMSKDDAIQLSEQLNNAGLKSLWLTSDLQSAAREEVLTTWEEGKEKVLVSTFVDGIDNSSTEDVILVGGTHSLYSLVQAIGRIRPRRQNFDRSTIHIFNSAKYLKFDKIKINDNVSTLLGAGILQQSQENKSPPLHQYYKTMFDVSGMLSLASQHTCLRQWLYEQFGIQSAACRHCTNCKTRNVINTSAVTSNTTLSKEDRNRKIVIAAVEEMLQACFVCKRASCDGQQCWPTKPPRCYACHSRLTTSNFHKRNDCMVQNPEIKTQSQSCSLCCMAMSDLIPCRGSMATHKPRLCPHKNRVKRVLLYNAENCIDNGGTARTVLSSTLTNHDHWFATMAANIASIKNSKRT